MSFYRLIKDFERVVKDEAGSVDPNTAKFLNERKQSLVLSRKPIDPENLLINLAICDSSYFTKPEFVLFCRSKN